MISLLPNFPPTLFSISTPLHQIYLLFQGVPHDVVIDDFVNDVVNDIINDVIADVIDGVIGDVIDDVSLLTVR